MFVWIRRLILWADSKRTVLCLTVSQWHYHLWCCRVERVCLYFLWENGYCLCYSCVLTKPCSLKRIMHNFYLFQCVFCLLHFLFCFLIWFNFFVCIQLWRTLSLDTFWATDCFCTKHHLCMHVVVRTMMWPQNSLLWYMYVSISVEHCSPLHLLAYAE